LKVMLDTITFTSSFIKYAFLEDVQHGTFSLEWVMFR
jgi:hypothetical protein